MILDFALNNWRLISLSLVLALAGMWVARIDHLRGHYKARVEAVTAERDTARAMIDAMIAKATVLAEQARRLTAQAKDIANATDQSSRERSIVYRDRVVRLPAAPDGCSAAIEDRTAESVDRPGSDPVVLERGDAMICAINTARLVEAHQWAIQVEGLQVESPASEPPVIAR